MTKDNKVNKGIFQLNEGEEKIVLEQIKYLHEEYVSIQQVFINFISVSVGVYAVILYQVFKKYNSKKFIFLILPFLFSLGAYNLIKYTMRMLAIDAYIRHLENLVNFSHKKILFAWQNFLVYANGSSLFGVLPQIPCYASLAIVLGVKFMENISCFEIFPGFGFLITVMLGIETLLLIIMLIHTAKQYYVVLDICKEVSVEIIDDYTWERLQNLHAELPWYLRDKGRKRAKSVNRKNNR